MNDVEFAAEEFSPGDGLINARDCFQNPEDLCKEFDYLFFLDLCAAIDSLVVHEHLHTVGSLPDPDANPLVAALLREDILQYRQLHTDDRLAYAQQVMKHPRARAILGSLPTSMPKIGLRAAATASTMVMDVVLEERLGLPLVTSAHQLPLYANLPDVRSEAVAAQELETRLAAHYADLRTVLESLREELDGPQYIRVPPIALEVFWRANTLEELPEIVLELRDEYGKVRDYFRQMQSALSDPGISVREKIKEKNKLVTAVSKLYTQDELARFTVATTFAKTMNDTVDVEALTNGAEITDIDWTKIVGYLIDKGVSAYWKFALRPLHASKQFYLDCSQEKIGRIVQKLFGHELATADFQLVDEYQQFVRSLNRKLKAALDSPVEQGE